MAGDNARIEWGTCAQCGMSWTANSLDEAGICPTCRTKRRPGDVAPEREQLAARDAERARNREYAESLGAPVEPVRYPELQREHLQSSGQQPSEQRAPVPPAAVSLRDQLPNFFTYHAPRPDQLPRYDRIRSALLECAQVIVDCTPAGADQTYAIRLLRMAGMTANAAIACGESEPAQ